MLRDTIAPTALKTEGVAGDVPAQAQATLEVGLLPGDSVESILLSLKQAVNNPAISFSSTTSIGEAAPSSSLSSDLFKAIQRATQGEFPVTPRVTPGTLKQALPGSPPAEPQGSDALLRDLGEVILPACTHWLDPRFFAYFPSNSSLAAVLADYAGTGLAQLGLNWQASPALTELEEVTTDWLRQMVGLSASWSGVIQDTASSGTLVSLLCARERASGYGASRGGLQEAAEPLIVYASGQSHSSVDKAALMAGFGRANVRAVAVDEHFALRPEALEDAVRTDLARGLRPCAVVATTGTTACTRSAPASAAWRSTARVTARRR